MVLTEINVDDLNKLMHLRIERLIHFFAASLPSCLIHIDAEQTLSVHCPHTEIVDDLLDELEDLCSHAWLILGVSKIALYFGQEEILSTNTYFR